MNLLTDVTDIPELNKPNVHIRDKQDLVTKINRIISAGHNKLQIVTDFDHTLTRHQLDNGNVVLTSFGMFRECPSVPQYYKDEDNRLSAIYKPIEVDPVMPIDEKIKHMIDWYIAAHSLLKGMKFPRNELVEVSKKMIDCFRIGVQELISWCAAQQVPVLVFSAGLGECVVAALTSADFLLPHVKVVSNFLAVDDNDTIIGIKGDVIHTYNKNEAAIKNTEYYELVKQRNNVILMGDNIGDAGMAEGMDHCDVVVKIGFLGRNTDANLHNYMNKFDVVLVNDHTMDIANAILKRLL
ncbi:7-methylguanosine phosphate-specific 5'-nucleotidase [Aricia agestis]|uniref:7-methylguanosine phosphate-specific 5'-nucleotidase n=1 Tax=Aricia agestis TaxID=91739 RepID=UPI001C206EE7|nr:7-methylguanosine phosphate-specific 5'-nucleotidase [Aricia agestis]XP_041973037.1 7-methylguanosine phosphate-specific 5'-nucleotidase [Aricia agestis]XP_041973039.1 7-methylguanosine phosphate-specific 5'-nucleotidase [Aricia agestis]